MKEHCIPCRHLKVDSRVTGVIVLHTVVHLINTTLQQRKRERERERKGLYNKVLFFTMTMPHLPLRVVVLKQRASVCSRKDH